MNKAKTKLRPAKTSFAFLVDGNCEYWYIQLLKRNEGNLRVDLKPEIPQRKELSELKKYLPDYEKTRKYYMQKNDIYKRLKPFLPIAIDNAKAISRFEIDNPCGAAQMNLFYEAEVESIKIIDMLS